MSSRSIAIAGAGIVGMSIAWRLAQRGFSVTIFDKGAVGSEASWAGAGMLAPGGEVEFPGEFASFVLESRAMYAVFVRELAEESRLAIDFQERGAIDLAFSAADWAALQERAARQTNLGILSEPVPASTVASDWPLLRRDGLVGARFVPGDGVVNPRDVVLALAAVCRRLGVRVVQDCAVLCGSFPAGRVEVKTVAGSDRFDALVVAAGAWSSSIVFDGLALPPAHPVRGHLLGYQQPPNTCPGIARCGHTYLLQRQSGLLISGASTEQAGFDRSIDPEIVGRLRTDTSFLLPHLGGLQPSEVWNGLRPASDSLHVGRWLDLPLYLAYGHYRNGILLAPATGEKVAGEISALS